MGQGFKSRHLDHKAAIKKILPQKTPILSGFSPFLGQKSVFCAITVYAIFSGEFVDINQVKIKRYVTLTLVYGKTPSMSMEIKENPCSFFVPE